MQSGGEAVLAQLPHVDVDVLKKLARKRVRSLGDLQGLTTSQRNELLVSAGAS